MKCLYSTSVTISFSVPSNLLCMCILCVLWQFFNFNFLKEVLDKYFRWFKDTQTKCGTFRELISNNPFVK